MSGSADTPKEVRITGKPFSTLQCPRPIRRGTALNVEPGTGLPVELREHLVQEFDDKVKIFYHGYVPDGK